jgi:YD repeat-containing protein
VNPKCLILCLHDTKLTYNDVSNIIKRETEHGTYTYAYDDLDRLTPAEADGREWAHIFAFADRYVRAWL